MISDLVWYLFHISMSITTFLCIRFYKKWGVVLVSFAICSPNSIAPLYVCIYITESFIVLIDDQNRQLQLSFS